jgi:4-diphosphocytidyl-2-C-methyl-D-erythritol kinase
VTALRYRAHAKINLALDVREKRGDGYHEIRTIYQSVDLCDTIEVFPAPAGFDFTCSDPDLPSGADNIVVKAASALRQATGCQKGARVHLTKRVPWQAGLGGGSSDAAVALLALARLWRLPSDAAALLPVATTLGSDVPFFLVGGTALGVGRGEEVYPLPDAPLFHLLVVKPSSGMSTSDAYRLLDGRLTPPPGANTIPSIVQGVLEGRLEDRLFFNRFEEVAAGREGEGAALRKALLEAGASGVLLAGSGSAWVGMFQSRARARDASRKMAHRGITVLLTQTLSRKDYWERTLPRMEKETLP